MKNLGKIILIFAVTILAWFLFALFYNHPTVPSPFEVIANVATEMGNDLFINVLYSGTRIFIASFFAVIIGVPLGIAMGYKETWNRWVSPMIYFSYPIPKLALLPILMLLFGLGEVSKLLMIFMIIFFPVVMDVAAGVKSMDKEPFEVLKSYGISGKTICTHVVFPGVLPSIFNSLKVTTGIALSVLFFAENYGTTRGMGYYIMNSWQKMDYVDLYTGVLVLSIFGFIIFCFIDFLERKLTQWK
ncbi:MAG: ABC transporter permease [Clostridiales bacterium]